jgi:hypothetical protein
MATELVFPFIYVSIIISLFLFTFAFSFKEWSIGAISGMMFILNALYILNNGVNSEYNFLITSMAIIMLCLGFYIVLRAVLDKLELWN